MKTKITSARSLDVYKRQVREVRDCSQTSVELILAQGMIKGEKWDYLLQKSAELGVAEIIPFVSSRCVVKIKDEKSEKKIVRWNKILCEACEQCKRSTLVRLQPPCTFSQLSQIDADLRLIAYEDADCKSERLCEVLRAHPSPKLSLIHICYSQWIRYLSLIKEYQFFLIIVTYL